MLSKKFIAAVHKILEKNDYVQHYDITQPIIKYEMTSAHSNIWYCLRELSTNNILGAEQGMYNNSVCNGILSSSVHNNGKKGISNYHIEQVAFLDYINAENQQKISEYLNALDVNYTLDFGMYDKIKDISSKLVLKHTMWEYALLKIHFHVIMCGIYFVWNTDRLLYIPDIIKFIDYSKKIIQTNNLVPIDAYDKFNIFINLITNSDIKCEDLVNMFQFMESLVKKYALTEIFETIKSEKSPKSPDIIQPQLKPSDSSQDLLSQDSSLCDQSSEKIHKKTKLKISKPLKSTKSKSTEQKSSVSRSTASNSSKFATKEIKTASKTTKSSSSKNSKSTTKNLEPMISINELDNIKVQGLKEYCVKFNLNTTKCKVRNDYIELLTPLVK